MAKKNNYYVVWNGVSPGIYTSWEECQKHIVGVSNVRYKGFKTLSEAESAFEDAPEKHWGNKSETRTTTIDENHDIIKNSLSVDAACSGNPGPMEYQGVYTATRTPIFLNKYPLGTNNIGEFLAIVHCLAYQKQHNLNLPIYSDSKLAMGWIKARKCRTKLEVNPKTKELFEVIKRAELWLENNSFNQPILKWDTRNWGEIPADFGRK